MSTNPANLKRTLAQWTGCDPAAMAWGQSHAAVENAFADARADITTLAADREAVLALLIAIVTETMDYPATSRHSGESYLPTVLQERAEQLLTRLGCMPPEHPRFAKRPA